MTQELPALGISCDFIDGTDPKSWECLLRPTTRVIYVESMTNPLLGVVDLPAVVHFARAHDLLSMIDNTFATPVNFRPLEMGFDLSIHSGTKYLNGHDDIAAGCVIGRGEQVERIRHRLNHLGGSLDPHACFLLNRGLMTLALRVRQQNSNALRLARFLGGHSAVKRVIYPGLENHPQHTRAKELFQGYGGVLAFEARGGEEETSALLGRLKIAVVAPSLGGVHTLIGLNPSYEVRLADAGVVFSGLGPGGEVRIIELTEPPFFVATLFVPRPQVVDGGPHPIYAGLTEAVRKRRQRSDAVEQDRRARAPRERRQRGERADRERQTAHRYASLSEDRDRARPSVSDRRSTFPFGGRRSSSTR